MEGGGAIQVSWRRRLMVSIPSRTQLLGRPECSSTDTLFHHTSAKQQKLIGSRWSCNTALYAGLWFFKSTWVQMKEDYRKMRFGFTFKMGLTMIQNCRWHLS